MTSIVACKRCGTEKQGLGTAPFPGPTGLEIFASTCRECWVEWEKMEVMVINELRLNFMDPAAQSTLNQHMKEFLGISPPSES